jgi:hypothetical protein
VFGLLIGYGMILVVSPFRTLFDLMPLGVSNYALIGSTAIAWGFSLYWAWRVRLLERFLRVDGQHL